MFLNEPKPIKLQKLPEDLQKLALESGYEADFTEAIFHNINGSLFFVDDEHGYCLTMSIAMEEKYPRLFAEQDEGSTEDVLITGCTLEPLGDEPSDFDSVVLSYLYPDVEPGDWADVIWA